MSLDHRLDKLLTSTESTSTALNSTALDDFLSTQQPELEPEKVAGLGSAITGLAKKLTGKAGKAAKAIEPERLEPPHLAEPPMPAAPVQPAKAPPAIVTPAPAPARAPRLTQPQQVEKLITPSVAADVNERALMRATINPEPLGKPPDEIFNYMRMGVPDDAKLFIDEVAKAAGVKQPTRVTHAEILADLQANGYKAADVDWLVSYADDKEAMRRVAMARDLLVTTAKLTQDMARQLVTNPSPELALKYHQSTVLLGQISRGVKNIGTDHARALGIMRATPTSNLEALEGLLNSAGGIDNLVAHAGKLAAIDLSDPHSIKRAADLAERSTFSKAKDIWVTTWINGLLSSPITHAKNIMGNEMLAAIQVPERFTASLIGRARGADVGDRVEMSEAVAMLRGMVAGQLKGMEAFGKGFMANAPVTTSGSKLADAGATITDFGDYLGWGGMAGRAANLYGKAVTLPGRTLLAEDEYFKTQGYFMELYAQASRRGAVAREEALAAGKTVTEAKAIEAQAARNIIDNPPDDISAASWDAAKYLTFTNPLEVGSIGAKFQELAANNVVARMYLPFVRTPVNIATATLERTPFAPFTKSFRDAWEAGGIPRDMAIARFAVGSSMLTTAGYLASIGRITGSGPGDKGQREAQERSGMQPYAFVFYKDEVDDPATRKLLNDHGRITETNDKVFWSFQGLEPLGGILSMGANYADYARYQDNVELVEQVGLGMTFGLARYMMELPYLQGMSEFVHALTGYGSGEITPDVVRRLVDSLSKTATNFVVGGSPAGAYSSAQATAERYLNPEASETRVPASVAPGLRGVMEAFNRYKSRTPGLSDTLPAKTNRWGEPIEHGEGALYETVSPVRVKPGKQKEVDRVWLAFDLPRAQPSRLTSWSERPDMAGVRVELSAEAFNELKRLYAWEVRDGNGDNVQTALVHATKDPAFDRLSFGTQQSYLMKLDSVFMTKARSLLVNESRFAPMLQAEFESKKLAADAYGIYSDELKH